MAVEVESTSQVEEFLGVLRRRAAWILAPLGIVLSLGVAFAVVVPKKYVTTTRVLVRNTLAGFDAQARSGSNSAREAQVAEHQILSSQRIIAVLEELQWPEYLELDRNQQIEYVENVEENVEVNLPVMPADSGQQVVNMEFAHNDPVRAAEFLGALRDKWQDQVLDRGRRAEAQAFEMIKQQKFEKERERERLNNEVTTLRKQYEILPPDAEDRASAGPSQHPIFERRAQAGLELEELDAEIERLSRTLEAKRRKVARLEEEIPAKESLAGEDHRDKIDSKYKEIEDLRELREEKRYLPAHPKWKQIEYRIQDLQEEIRYLEGSESETYIETRYVENKDRQKMLLEIQTGEEGLEEARRERDSLAMRLAEVSDQATQLSEVYGEITRMTAELNLLNATLEQVEDDYWKAQQAMTWMEGPGGNPFEILADIHVPTEPTEPNPVLIILFSLFGGLAIGMGLAVVIEYRKSCFRSATDIGRVMAVPVLGTINAVVTRAQRVRSRLGRVVAAGAVACFMALVGYVTWAWSSSPHLLSDPVLEAIEQFRSSFK